MTAAAAGIGMQQAAERSLAGLRALEAAPEWGWMHVRRPGPTAAFSRRDSLTPGFPAAAAAAARHGFEPIIRPVGGRLAAYHDEALVIDVAGRHDDPRRDVLHRFRTFATAVASGLGALGMDARVGPVPGEYCPGQFSVNAEGRTKIAGTAQRVTRRAFLFSAVVLVGNPEPVRAVLTDTYPLLGLAWDEGTVGCVGDHVRGAGIDDVHRTLVDALSEILPIDSTVVKSPGRLTLASCWDGRP